MKRRHIAVLILLQAVFSAAGAVEQIAVPRIEAMPNHPSPYFMRDWKQAALGYDSLVFDLNARGEYLPLIWIVTQTVNYPQHESFGLATVVGTMHPLSAEAINVLPAVIGASLVGVDKSRQHGRNWVLMCEEFFNNRPEEYIYLNHPVYKSGDDWWYETMPNVFFYQLADLYPGTGDFERQFRLVAEQWLKAVRAMGGDEAPWTPPDMKARAFSFSEMKPLKSGVPEPEAAGAVAWLLYLAYCKTGDERYRKGAEWTMEFLNAYPSNPAYELQLPYGVYIAARMNAELETRYNVERMIGWCFDPSPLRNWGAVLGNWGGYDVHGLIGELAGNDYAFLMNGFEQAGALVPMVRYDERFARAVAKWVLNLANASRLFYSPFLPNNHQDGLRWASQYDKNGYIGYEALRKQEDGVSPYATGDAVRGGWGRTNLSLYGSSHVGILGGIIETTEVLKILKLDLLKTDYFRAPAFPTFLLFNPYDTEQSITLKVPANLGSCDIYDAVGDRFVARGVTAQVVLRIPADHVIMPVFVPANGVVTFSYDRMLINGVVVDFHSGRFIGNYPPRIKGLAARPAEAHLSQSVQLFCEAEDRESPTLRYAWFDAEGKPIAESKIAAWLPMKPGEFVLRCSVEDGAGGKASGFVTVRVVDNRPPVVVSLSATPDILDRGESAVLSCSAVDADGDSLVYEWRAEAGILQAAGSRATWQAPHSVGVYPIVCIVRDVRGAETGDTLRLVVGRLVGAYALDGHALDRSGFDNHGRIKGAEPTADRFGIEAAALRFDGKDDAVVIPNHLTLNSRRVAFVFWLKWDGRADREEYIVSHGSWDNRLKASILADGHLRWTIKTNTGTADLDSQTSLAADRWFHLCVQYDESKMQIWLDGRLDAEKNWSGPLNVTAIDLLFGQTLPGETQYNFKGVLDDLSIHNRPLSAAEIAALHLDVASNPNAAGAESFPPFPNPFNSRVTIPLPAETTMELEICNLAGRIVRRWEPERLVGLSQIDWNGRDDRGGPVPSGCYFVVLRSAGKSSRWKIVYLK